MINNKKYLNLLRLAAFSSFGPNKIKHLEKRFLDLGDIFTADINTLILNGVPEKLATKFTAWKNLFNFNSLLTTLEKDGISFVTWHDSEYPKLLLEISSPPPILFFQGNIKILNQDNLLLSIVGSRNNTGYAEKTLQQLIPGLTKHGFKIISGLAIGVDTLAHRITLNTKGLTIAVLGSGLSHKKIYPTINRRLTKEIIEQGGLILSEFLPDVAAQKNNFPRRNRIISGLAKAIMVVEAKAKSGSLITAHFALEQNRDVLAVPGNIFLPSSEGTNRLIQSGAKLIITLNDVLEIFSLEITKKNKNYSDDKIMQYKTSNLVEEKILNLIKLFYLKGEKINTEQIINLTKLDTPTINSTLSILEVTGVIKNRGDCFEPSL